MVATEDIWNVLRKINDPEMPISIVDLGIVEHVAAFTSPAGDAVTIDITPTFVGCPALDMLRQLIISGVERLPGVASVTVNFVYNPPWSVDRITDEGRQSLRQFGVTTPPSHAVAPAIPLGLPRPAAPDACPFCGSESIRLDSPFGPTRCRMIYFCTSCRNQFEHLKRV